MNFDNECNLILESLSETVYHYTHLRKLLNILKTNKFNLTTSFGQGSDDLSTKNKNYYISFTRSRVGQFHYPAYKGGSESVLLVIDGKKLSNRYEGKPVEYWQFGRQMKNEMEDRLFSNKPEIDNATSYIKEIHTFSAQLDSNEYKLLRQAYIEASKSKIPFYHYNDSKAFDLLNKQKSIKLSELEPEQVEERPSYNSRYRNFLAGYMELLSVNPNATLSKEAKRKLDRMYNNDYEFYKNEWLTSIKNDIHNDKTNPIRKKHADALIKKLQSLGIKNLSEMSDYIVNKFKSENK